jgi:hypothetical protein
MAFVILGVLIYAFRKAQGNPLEYTVAIIATLIFWYLLGLKIAFSNLRNILIITLIFASIIMAFRIFFPLQSSIATMGILKEYDLNPGQISLIKRSHDRALEIHFDKKPGIKERYFEMGDFANSQDGLHYSNKGQELNLLKLPKTLLWTKHHLTADNLDKDTDKVKSWFVSSFAYTLSPGTLNTSTPLDQFLFERRTGFCEHFAAALCTILDLKGYKAKVAYGYAGGAWNPIFKVLTYDNSDAHAWVEAFDPKLNQYKIIDPTSWIFPEISQGRSFEGDYAWVFLTLLVIGCLGGIFLIRKGSGVENFLFKISKLENKYGLESKGLTLSERISKISIANRSIEKKLLISFKIYLILYSNEGKKPDQSLKKSLRAW